MKNYKYNTPVETQVQLLYLLFIQYIVYIRNKVVHTQTNIYTNPKLVKIEVHYIYWIF